MPAPDLLRFDIERGQVESGPAIAAERDRRGRLARLGGPKMGDPAERSRLAP